MTTVTITFSQEFATSNEAVSAAAEMATGAASGWKFSSLNVWENDGADTPFVTSPAPTADPAPAPQNIEDEPPAQPEPSAGVA